MMRRGYRAKKNCEKNKTETLTLSNNINIPDRITKFRELCEGASGREERFETLCFAFGTATRSLESSHYCVELAHELGTESNSIEDHLSLDARGIEAVALDEALMHGIETRPVDWVIALDKEVPMQKTCDGCTARCSAHKH